MPDPRFWRIGQTAFLCPGKNAGTAILTACCWQTRKRDPGPDGIHSERLFRYLKHEHVQRGEFFLIAAVRDPVARLVSCWRNKCGGNLPAKMARLGFHQGQSWSHFIDLACRVPDREADLHFRAQAYDLIERIGGKPLDLVLRVERLETDWRRVEEHMGWPPLGLPRDPWRANTAQRLSLPAPVVTEAQRAMIEARFAADYERFGYYARAA